MKKKKLLILIGIIFLLGFNIPYKYNSEKAVNYATLSAEKHSRCMCAWYVMKALHRGGCFPCGIYPAYGYVDILPKLNAKEVTSDFKRGDICVLSQNSKSQFGHIAIYNGKKWVSDFTHDFYPSNTYKKESSYKIYRIKDGWNTANIWVSPKDLFEYVNVLINNYSRIKI